MYKHERSKLIKQGSIAYRWQMKFLGNAYEYWSSLQAKKATPTLDQKKFVIFSGYQSACESLVSLLESNPFVYMDGAILEWPVAKPIRLIQNRRKKIDHKIYGFKLLSRHCQSIQPNITCTNNFFRQLSACGFQIIYIENENPLREALVQQLKQKKSAWRKKKDKRYVIDFDSLMDQLTLRKKQTANEKAALNGISHLILNDEKDFESVDKIEATVSKIASFLDAVPIRSQLQSSKPNPLIAIANIDDLIKQLEKTEYKSHAKRIKKF